MTRTDLNREQIIDHLSRTPFDVLVIGGGINGAGTARDLAMRGLSVALVEKGDYANGTSSASTKLIHGGLRYLETFQFGLVYESCRERLTLQQIAPHLVHPFPFLIPIYRPGSRPFWMIRAGMALYDLMALGRNTRPHQILKPAAALQEEPQLKPAGLAGAARYWDCRMDDARLCLENILAAQGEGATCANYLEVTSLLKTDGRIKGAVVRDCETGSSFEISARLTLNATGPWLDKLCGMDENRSLRLRPTRGTHILVPRISHGNEALYLAANRDDRLFFVIPWGDLSLIGTTDIDFRDDPDTTEPTTEDIDYLLAETSRQLNREPLQRGDVIAAFAGLRPLVTDDQARTSRIPREHHIFRDPSGLISVGGGKYTTYRSLAAEVSDLICQQLGKGKGRSQTAKHPLPGGHTGPFIDFCTLQRPLICEEFGLTNAHADLLLGRYGSRWQLLAGLLRQQPELTAPIVAGSPLLAGEVVYAARYESARTPEDILRRRTSRALEAGRGMAELAAVSQLLGTTLQVSPEQVNCWQDNYRTIHASPYPDLSEGESDS
jgi:glycerol-3-phosphate dehydrogenase